MVVISVTTITVKFIPKAHKLLNKLQTIHLKPDLTKLLIFCMMEILILKIVDLQHQIISSRQLTRFLDLWLSWKLHSNVQECANHILIICFPMLTALPAIYQVNLALMLSKAS